MASSDLFFFFYKQKYMNYVEICFEKKNTVDLDQNELANLFFMFQILWNFLIFVSKTNNLWL